MRLSVGFLLLTVGGVFLGTAAGLGLETSYDYLTSLEEGSKL